MARFGRKEGLNHWLTLESWLGMVIDAVLVKAMDSSEEEEPTIIGSLLGKEAVKLVVKIQRLLTTQLWTIRPLTSMAALSPRPCSFS